MFRKQVMHVGNLVFGLVNNTHCQRMCNVKVDLLMMSHPVLPVCLVYLPAYLVLILLFHLSCLLYGWLYHSCVVPYGSYELCNVIFCWCVHLSPYSLSLSLSVVCKSICCYFN